MADVDVEILNQIALPLQLQGKKQHIRALLIDRVMLQHEVILVHYQFPVTIVLGKIAWLHSHLKAFCTVTPMFV